MTTEAEIVAKLQDAADADGGIACPVCHGPTHVLHRRNPDGYITRRRQCGRCKLRVTTTERIVGGFTPQELEAARANWKRWQSDHGRYTENTHIDPIQLRLFET